LSSEHWSSEGAVRSCYDGGMTTREISGLILRVCGLVLFYRGFLGLFAPIVMVFGMGHLVGALTQAIVPVISIAISVYLLRGAPAVVRFCYPG
jgi:hypothetical protein